MIPRRSVSRVASGQHLFNRPVFAIGHPVNDQMNSVLTALILDAVSYAIVDFPEFADSHLDFFAANGEDNIVAADQWYVDPVAVE